MPPIMKLQTRSRWAHPEAARRGSAHNPKSNLLSGSSLRTAATKSDTLIHYDGQAAELVAGLGNPHVGAVAEMFSPFDRYRELLYPGGCATGGRFARWMCETQIQEGVPVGRAAVEIHRRASRGALAARAGQGRRRAARSGPAGGGDRRAPNQRRHAEASEPGAMQ
jgi:hypothetical protein